MSGDGAIGEKKRLTITVLEKKHFADIVNEYCHDDPVYPPCEIFRVGQRFEADDPSIMPDGFCEYAWTNIQMELRAAFNGEQLPWVRKPHTFIACCTDGLRPVIFEIVMNRGD